VLYAQAANLRNIFISHVSASYAHRDSHACNVSIRRLSANVAHLARAGAHANNALVTGVGSGTADR